MNCYFSEGIQPVGVGTGVAPSFGQPTAPLGLPSFSPPAKDFKRENFMKQEYRKISEKDFYQEVSMDAKVLPSFYRNYN
jgi:hypothetical protein